MTNLRRRLERLEASFEPSEVGHAETVFAAYSRAYADWLDEQVGAGRMDCGKFVRLLLAAGDRFSSDELDDLIAQMNRRDENPKPARLTPDWRADDGGSGLADLQKLPPPVEVPAPVEEQPEAQPATAAIADPARIARVIPYADPDPPANYRPWERG